MQRPCPSVTASAERPGRMPPLYVVPGSSGLTRIPAYTAMRCLESCLSSLGPAYTRCQLRISACLSLCLSPIHLISACSTYTGSSPFVESS